MSPTDPPDPHDDAGDQGEPSVGNILGFSLLFRDRKAMLALQRRGLAPGVRVREYEAEIPGVSFPLKGPLRASAFRNRRCLTTQATIAVDERALGPWLRERFVGARVQGVTITDARIEFGRRLARQDDPQPVVALQGAGADGSHVTLIASFDLAPDGRYLDVRTVRHWLFGTVDVDGDEFFRGLIRRLRPEIPAESDGELRIDPSRLALTRPFVSAGWKAPDLRELDISDLSLSKRGLTIDFRSDAPERTWPSNGHDQKDPVARAIRRARELLRAGEVGDALDVLEQITAALDDFPAAQLAAIRWRVDASRFADRAACLRALREWLGIQPTARQARLLVTTLLGLAGETRELAQLLAADCRRPHDDLSQARLELALATVLIEKLDDPRSAMAIVGPLVGKIRDLPPLRSLMPQALVALAQARVVDSTRSGPRRAPHALSALDEALDLTDDPQTRAGMRARVARSFAAHGGETLALQLLSQAIAEDPEDTEQLDDAVALSLRIGETESAVELLRLRLESAPRSERVELRRRLLRVLAELDGDEHRKLARAELGLALENEPDDPDYLRMAADLERHEGFAAAAAEHLARLADVLSLGRERTDAEAERSRLLKEAGQLDHAWEVIRTLLDRDFAGQDVDEDRRGELLDVLELGLELAPPIARPDLLNRLIDTATGERRAQALRERAAQGISVSDKLADLWAAVEELERPAPVLAEIATLIDGDDAAALLELADVAAAHADGRTEVSTRGRAGMHLAATHDYERAVVQLGRALEIEPYRADLQLHVGLTLEALHRGADALGYLLPLLDPEKIEESGADEVDLGHRCGRLLIAGADDPRAAEVLATARKRVDSDDPRGIEIAEDLFAVLYRLGRTVEARDLARKTSGELKGPQQATWLVRAAQLSDSTARLALLRDADKLRPDDLEVAEALEAALHAAGERDELERHLLRRLARGSAPDQRATILQRLVACLELDDADRSAELTQRLEELIDLDADRVDALLRLGQLRKAAGDDLGALEAWRKLPRLMERGDARVFEPGMALAQAAANRHDLPRARTLLATVLDARPGDEPALRLLRDVARQLREPQLSLEAAKGLLALATSPSERAAFELECAEAHVALGDAFEAFSRLERGAASVEARSALHLQIAETWLEFANREGNHEQEAKARAELRRALGPDLPIEELLTEVRLLADELGRIPEALVLLEAGLCEHDGDGRLLAILERLATKDELTDKCVAVLRSCAEVLDPGEGRDRICADLARSARERDEAATVIFALDRLSPDASADPSLLDLRDWAIRRLDRVDEEIAEIEARLVHGAPGRGLLARLLRALDGDEQRVAARLTELSENADRDAAIALASAALSSMEESAEPGLVAPAVRALVEHGALQTRHWQQLESAVLRSDQPTRIAELAILARDAAALDPSIVSGRVDPILDRGLARFPDDPALHIGLARWLGIDDLESARPEQRALIEKRLETVAREHELRADALAALWTGYAARFPDETATQLLRDRAIATVDDPQARGALEAALRRSRQWPAVFEVLEAQEPTPDAGAWLDLAEAAAKDRDVHTEGRARGHAGLLLAAQGNDAGCVSELQRALAIDRDQPGLRHALGLALRGLGRPRDALGQLLPLAVREEPGLPGVDLSELAQLTGELLVDVDDLERAVELLSLARTRTEDASRRTVIARHLVSTLVGLERTADAKRVCTETANEVRGSERLGWLERAAELASGRERLDLLETALALDGSNERVLAKVEASLTELDDGAALEKFLRRCVEDEQRRGRRDEVAVSTIERLLKVLNEPARRDEAAGEMLELWRRVLALDERHADALLALGEYAASRGDETKATALWKRAGQSLDEGDARFFDPACTLARHAMGIGDLDQARDLLVRALGIRANDRAALGLLRDLAARIGEPALALRAAEGLLSHAETARDQAELEHEAARALESLARDEEALAALARGAERVELQSAQHVEIAESWLRIARKADDSDEQLRQEAKARSQLRRALGANLPTVDLLAEVTLLADRLDRLEPAIVLIEDALLERPRDSELLGRLEHLCERSEASDRFLRALRKLVDSLPTGTPRDALARRLAQSARGLDAARSALHALDRLSASAGGDSEMLDLRDWAVRKLGRVKDELGSLLERLRKGPRDAVLVTRLWRTLDSDARAAAQRLLELAEATDGEDRLWFADSALDLLREHAPSEVPLALAALRVLVEGGRDPGDAWTGLEETILETDDPTPPAALIGLIELGAHARANRMRGVAGRAEKLLERSLARFPDQGRLHALLRELVPGDGQRVEAALTRIEAIARAHRLDERGRARLIVGLADSLGADEGVDLLRRQALARIEERESFAHLLTTLRGRDAWSAVVDLLEARDRRDGIDADAWTSVAESAGDDPRAEARARLHLAAHWSAAEDHAAALEQLRRVTDLRPDDPVVADRLAQALEDSGDLDGALSQLLPLVAAGRHEALGLTQAQLAIRCGRLAANGERDDQAIEMFQLAFDQLVEVPVRLDAAEQLYPLLQSNKRAEQTRKLASACAELATDPAKQSRWLGRAAAASDGNARTELLERAYRLHPEDEELAAQLERSLAEAKDDEGLETLLRSRLDAASGVGVSDHAATIEIAERLLALLDAGRAPERIELLEFILRVQPEHVEARLELASAFHEMGRVDLAANHWRRLGDGLASDDPRMLTAARELGRLALSQGKAREAQEWLTRAQQIEGDDPAILDGLLEAGLRLEDHEQVVDNARQLLRLTHPPRPTAELHARIAAAERLRGELGAALSAYEEAARAAEPGSDAHRAVATDWLSLATSEDLDASIAGAAEAAARQAMREAMGDEYPSRLRIAEAALLARLGRSADAIGLLEQALKSGPQDEAAAAALETLATTAEDRRRVVGILDRFVANLEPSTGRRRLAERLGRLARDVEDAATALRAVDAIGDSRETAAEIIEIREWAVRSLNKVSTELATIDAQLLERPEGRLITRMLRMLDDDGEVCALRLLELCERATPEVATKLARSAIEVVRARCPDKAGINVRCLRSVAQHGSFEQMMSHWPPVEQSVVDLGDVDSIVELLNLAILGESKGEAQLGTSVRTLLREASRRQPGHAGTDEALWHWVSARKGDDPVAHYWSELDGLAQGLELRGTELASLYGGASKRTGHESFVRNVRQRATSWGSDDTTLNAFIELLRAEGAWEAVVDLLLARTPGPSSEVLLELADQAAAHAPAAESRARTAAAGVLRASGEADAALHQLSVAHDRDSSPQTAFALGHALEDAGRPGPALERYVPLLDADLATLGISAAELAERCALLFLEVGNRQQAAEMLLRTRELKPRDVPARLELAERAFELLNELGEPERAAALALDCTREASGDARAEWLVRASQLSDVGDRLAMLRSARDLRPDDDQLADELEEAYAAAGVRDELEGLLRERLAGYLDEPVRRDEAIDVVHRLLPLLEREPDRRSDVADLYATILRLEPDNLPALLTLAELRQETGDDEAALRNWIRAGELLPHDDDSFFEPACQLAQLLLKRDDFDHARIIVERALDIRPGDRTAFELLRVVAPHLGDAALTVRANEGLLAHEPAESARLELELARAQLELGEQADAFAALERAASSVVTGNDTHREIARTWLELATAGDNVGDVEALEREASAREQRRLALGDELPATELRAEVNLLATLDRTEQALELIESRIASQPGDELLLSALKDLCFATDRRDRYLEAMEAAVAAADSPDLKDRLAVELAYTAVELEDAAKLLSVLNAISEARAADPELLDLREWAVRQLGQVEHELTSLDHELLAEPTSTTLRTRMLRMLENDLEAVLRRMQQLAGTADAQTASALAESALGLAESAEPAQLGTLLEVGRALVEHDNPGAVSVHWDSLRDLALTSDRAEAMAGLLQLGLDASGGQTPLLALTDTLLDEAVVRFNGSTLVMAVLWNRARAEAPTDPIPAATARIQRIVDDRRVAGRSLALLWSGLSELLDRQDGARLLTARAEDLVDKDGEAFNGLAEALELRNHWPDVMRLLELRVATSEAPVDQVAALKHLSHICADILGDAGAAIRHLKRALEYAPEDPDLLLPLLDHHYARSELDRVIELSIRVMKHVPMGDAAFIALGHRAADAALAHGDHRFAESLIRRVVERCSDDYKTKMRLGELEALADDPEHRARMLQVIANRQAGSARVEALEERARLLVNPLGRLDEAIADLEVVLAEAPERMEGQLLLRQLYEKRARWADLAVMLERLFNRQAGLARSRTLRYLAGIYRDRLLDLGRAEANLRLALETLGQTADERSLADEIQLELVEVLEKQGRYADIVSHLRRELDEELGDELAADASSQRRVELLGHLARVLRDYLDDEVEAASIYERLERVGRLPEDGLATLARGYRNQHRHADLVRVLIARSEALGESGDTERKAEIDQRIGDLLEGPLRRPHDAARFYLDAYLANPFDNTIAGQRARVLLAGTDSVVNVRKLLLERIQATKEAYYPLALTLLSDLLAPHEEHEEEAETRYRMALKMDAQLAPALEGLGRLLARQGRLVEAVDPLMRAAKSLDLDPDRAAENAATAARALQELGRPDEAESVLRHALGRAPDAQRCLLELARLYGRLGRQDDEAHVLDELSALSLSSMLRAEVAFRRAMLLQPQFQREPFSEAGELGRTYLLEAVGSDAMHAQARQVLLELATARSEWSIVAHMLFLAIRELPGGAQRALTHLDLAEVYMDRLRDIKSAVRNLASALKQPTDDAIVTRKATAVAARFPEPAVVAADLERVAETDLEIDEASRARLYVAASELHRRAGDNAAAQRASQIVTELSQAPAGADEAARQTLATLNEEDGELKRERDALLNLLDSEDQAVERLHILGRLREIGRALHEDALAERSSKAQLELAHSLLESEADRDEAAAALLELFADRGDYGKIVELYEGLADRTEDTLRAAKMLTDAARFAWTGQRDAGLAMAIIGRALVRRPGDPDATGLLTEIAGVSDDPNADESIYRELSRLDETQRSPRLALRLAAAALRLGHSEEGRRSVFQLLQTPLPPELRLQALGLLDGILDDAGLTRDRIPILEERLRLTQTHSADRAADVALELAQVQAKVGILDSARRTCIDALGVTPSHTGLTLLYAELLERAEDWANLAATLEQLANISLQEDEQSKWLTRAARVHLEHAVNGPAAMGSARRLLSRACEVSKTAAEPRSVLLPLAFAEAHWAEVIDLTVELRAIAGDDDEALLFGALTEALIQGSRAIARAIGPRHHPLVRRRLLWPALERILGVIALEGPVPRLDAVIGAAGALCGGTEELQAQLQSWAAGQPEQAGTNLAIARLNEATGKPVLARHLYQIAAFLAPTGPIPGLVERLPDIELPADPLHEEAWIPREYGGALREILIQLRPYTTGLRGQGGSVAAPTNAIERAALNAAARPAARWRDRFGFLVPLRFTQDEVGGGCGVRNEAEPTIVVNEEFASAPSAEQSFRLAEAAAHIAMGTAMLIDTHPLPLAGLLDALAQLADPAHEGRSRGAALIADTLAARGLRAGQLPADLRSALRSELEHWIHQPGALAQLSKVVKRAGMLMAVRLSGQLDGALLAMARDREMLTEGDVVDGRPVLETDDAQWLMRILGVSSSDA